MIKKIAVLVGTIIIVVIAATAIVSKWKQAGHSIVGEWLSSPPDPKMKVDFGVDHGLVFSQTESGHTAVLRGTYVASSDSLDVTLAAQTLDGVPQSQPTPAQPLRRTYVMNISGDTLKIQFGGRTVALHRA